MTVSKTRTVVYVHVDQVIVNVLYCMRMRKLFFVCNGCTLQLLLRKLFLLSSE